MLTVKECIGKKCIVQRNAATTGDFMEISFIKLSENETHVLEKIKCGKEQWEEVSKYDSRWKIVDTVK